MRKITENLESKIRACDQSIKSGYGTAFNQGMVCGMKEGLEYALYLVKSKNRKPERWEIVAAIICVIIGIPLGYYLATIIPMIHP